MALVRAVLPLMAMMILLVLLTNAKKYEKCQLAGELLARRIRGRDIPRLVCIAFYESGLDSNTIGYHKDNESQDHGLWQISDIMFIGREKPGGLCGYSAAQVRGDNLDNALDCVQLVLRKTQDWEYDKWLAWPSYAVQGRCKGDMSSFLGTCFLT